MSWEDVLKKPGIPTTGLYPKTKKDKDRMIDMVIGEGKKPVQSKKETKQDKMQRIRTGRMSLLADEILSEIEKEGGALGMKNLKQFASEKRLKEVLSMLEDAGKIFMHKNGDIYTHEPKK